MKKAKMTSDAFNKLIATTKAFCAKFPQVPVRGYIRMEFHADTDEVIAVAVDGYRMSVEHAVCESEEDFAIYIMGNIHLPKNKNVLIELVDEEAIFRCDGFIFGCRQPQGEFLNWQNVIPRGEPTFKIGFNGDYLLSALTAAKASIGGTFRKPIILGFRTNTEPVIIRTNGTDVKMVLPVRLKD